VRKSEGFESRAFGGRLQSVSRSDTVNCVFAYDLGQNSELYFVCSFRTQDDGNPHRNIVLRLGSVAEMIQLRFLASHMGAMTSWKTRCLVLLHFIRKSSWAPSRSSIHCTPGDDPIRRWHKDLIASETAVCTSAAVQMKAKLFQLVWHARGKYRMVSFNIIWAERSLHPAGGPKHGRLWPLLRRLFVAGASSVRFSPRC